MDDETKLPDGEAEIKKSDGTQIVFKQFKKTMSQINLAYKDYLSHEMIVFWYRFFYDKNLISLEQKIDEWIKSKAEPPSITDLL